MSTLIRAVSVAAVLGASTIDSSSAFVSPKSFVGRGISVLTKNIFYSKNSADEDAWDSPEDYEDFDNDTDSNKSKDGANFSTPNLGINIGAQLTPLTPEQAAELKEEARAEIDKAFDARLAEIEDLKKQTQKEFEESKKALSFASDLRARQESEKLMTKIDKLSEDFLSQNKELREGTKMAARADKVMRGKGVDVGSWGTIGGNDVLTAASMGTASGGLLGSVGAAISMAGASAIAESDEGGAPQPTPENRILIVCDDKQDESAKKVLDKFSTLLTESFDEGFDRTVIVDKYTPTSSIPLGGLNAQCAILVSSCVNGRSSAENILGRILKRTVLGGKIGSPPSHLVVLSSLGTERTDKFPYSMQNLMGGKLSKRREVEEMVIDAVKGRIPGEQVPLDYTIVKIGDVVQDEKAKGMIEIMPGDSLDGEVGIDAAANVLLQAVAFQPAARNATLSVIGGIDAKSSLEDVTWDDWFLRLDGPELLRIEDGLIADGASENEVDRKYEELSAYVREWSTMFEDGAKGTGLTTPVSVSLSNRNPVESEGTSMRSGVRLEFKKTNTGSAYQSKDEERAFEKENTSGSPSNKKVVTIKTSKQAKEGGVEVLVEKTTSGTLRVRARRCNMDDKTVVKELSEETIIKRVQEAVGVWSKQM